MIAQRRFLSTTVCSNIRRKIVTQNWLDTIVIGEKLCPFAPPVRKEPQLRITVSNGTTHDEIINDITSEVHCLVGGVNNAEKRSTIQRAETTLVVLNEEKCPSLLDFRDLVHLSWRVQDEAIIQHGYDKDLQIVLFHPMAKHDTYIDQGPDEEEDAANYTIRSPFPIIHLLREEDVMKAVYSGYKDLEGLPTRNKARMRNIGVDGCKRKLKGCFKLD